MVFKIRIMNVLYLIFLLDILSAKMGKVYGETTYLTGRDTRSAHNKLFPWHLAAAPHFCRIVGWTEPTLAMKKTAKKEPNRLLTPGKPDFQRCDNQVITAIYTPLSFLPMVRRLVACIFLWMRKSKEDTSQLDREESAFTWKEETIPGLNDILILTHSFRSHLLIPRAVVTGCIWTVQKACKPLLSDSGYRSGNRTLVSKSVRSFLQPLAAPFRAYHHHLLQFSNAVGRRYQTSQGRLEN